MPSLETKITLGEIAAIAVLMIGLISYAVKLEGKVTYIDDNGTKAVRGLVQELNLLRVEMAELKTIIKMHEYEEKRKFN